MQNLDFEVFVEIFGWEYPHNKKVVLENVCLWVHSKMERNRQNGFWQNGQQCVNWNKIKAREEDFAKLKKNSLYLVQNPSNIQSLSIFFYSLCDLIKLGFKYLKNN